MKASSFLFLVAVLFSLSALARVPTSNVVVSDPVKTARDFILKGERVDAIRTLVDAMKNEKKETLRWKELQKNLEGITEMFLTEASQGAYELGRALVVQDVSGAVSRLKDALQLEPDNETIIGALARVDLLQGKCDRSLANTADAFARNPFSKKLAIVRLQAFACLQKGPEFRSLLMQSQLESGLPPYPLLVELARAQLAYFEEKWESALVSLERAKSFDATMPETYYWIGQVLEKQQKDDLSAYRRYVELCQDSAAKKKRFFDTEPRTCLEAKSIEKTIENRSMKSSKP